MNAIQRAVLAFRIWRRRKAIVDLALQIAQITGDRVRVDWAAEHLARADTLAREAVSSISRSTPLEHGDKAP